jgi:hypothetical protein
MTARRRHTGDGASAQNGDNTGVVEVRRRRVGRYGVLHRGRGCPFIGVGGEARSRGAFDGRR